MAGEPQLHFVALGNFAFSLKKTNPDAAIFYYKQSVNIIQTLRKNIALLGKETLHSYQETVEPYYRNLTTLLIDQGRIPEAQQIQAMLKEEEYFEFATRSADSAGSLNTTVSFTDREKKWYEKYEILKTDFNGLVGDLKRLKMLEKNKVITDDEQKTLNALKEKQKKLNIEFQAYTAELENSLKTEASGDLERRDEITRLGLKDIRVLRNAVDELAGGTVLINYFIGEDKVYIILTTPGFQQPKIVNIKKTELNAMIAAFKESLLQLHDPRRSGKALYDILIKPIAADLEKEGAKTLMLYLDGALRYIPFAALYDGEKYLVETYRTVNYTHINDTNLKEKRKNIVHVAALGVSKKVKDGYDPLAGVADELAGIVKTDATPLGIYPGEILMNEQFTQKSFVDAAENSEILHISSHFTFVPGSYRDSKLLLGDGSEMTVYDMKSEGEIFKKHELITLSACETALSGGKGKEVEGFATEVQQQGAKAVIATLWKVEDKSTSLLMRDFYRRMAQSKDIPKIEALRQAQIAMLEGTGAVPVNDENPETEVSLKSGTGGTVRLYNRDKQKPYAHPYFWAPFILFGNWK